MNWLRHHWAELLGAVALAVIVLVALFGGPRPESGATAAWVRSIVLGLAVTWLWVFCRWRE